MTTQLAPLAVQRFYDNSGNLAIGGKVYTYAAGTSTPVATYTDSTGGTPNTNPVILNARGEGVFWLTPGQAYKFVVYDAANNLLWSADNLTGPDAAALSLAAQLASTSGASLIEWIQPESGAIAETQQATNQRVKWMNQYGSPAQAVATVPLGTLHVQVGTTQCSNLQLEGTSLQGEGPGSILKANGTTQVLQLGYVSSPTTWTYRSVCDLIIDGNALASDGIEYADGGTTQLSGRWVIERVNFVNCNKGINKPTGNIGNTYSHISCTLCNYGYYAIGTNSPNMHAGVDSIEQSHFESCNLAAIYIDSTTSGTGADKLQDVVIENNPGFGIFVKNWATGYTPFTMDNVWFEANHTSGSVTINATVYTPVDVRLENVVQAIMINGIVPSVQLVNSFLKVGNCFMNDTQTAWNIDANSVVEVEDARIDSGMHPVMVKSLLTVTRPLGSAVQCFRAPPRGIVNPNQARLQSLSYSGAGPFSFPGTTTVSASSVVDGVIFGSCAELVIPAGNTQTQANFTTTSGKWCVMTFDVKFVSGNLSALVLSCVQTNPFCGDLHTLLATGEWVTVAVVGQSSAAITAQMRLQNTDTASMTLRLSAWQVCEFATQRQAIEYYNNGVYAS